MIPAVPLNLSTPQIRFVRRTSTLTTKEAMLNWDPIFIVVSRHKVNFIRTSCEEDGEILCRDWRVHYNKHSGLGLPVLPDKYPDNGI